MQRAELQTIVQSFTKQGMTDPKVHIILTCNQPLPNYRSIRRHQDLSSHNLRSSLFHNCCASKFHGLRAPTIRRKNQSSAGSFGLYGSANTAGLEYVRKGVPMRAIIKEAVFS